jgi:outer membrane receptor protein involved in Fe transport
MRMPQPKKFGFPFRRILMDSRHRKWIFGLALLALPWAVVFGQADINCTVEGYVIDPLGNFVQGAEISLEGGATLRGHRKAVTDQEGFFIFRGLPVGTYTLRAEMIGFPAYEVSRIVLNPGDRRTFDIPLRQGLVETVQVVAERHLIDTLDTSEKDVIDADYANGLPLVARRYQQILTLFPGVSNNEGFTQAQYHIRGSRVEENGFRIDGATINDFVTGTFGLNVNQNAIERFELTRGGFQAEYGEQSGGIANIVTKSGTNEFEFHYSGTFRTDSFGSSLDNFDTIIATGDVDADLSNNNNPRPETQQWQEFAVGGPIVKDKLWYFGSFQYWQEDIGSIFNDSERTGDRYHAQFKTTWQVSADNTFVANFLTDPSEFDNLILDARYAPGTNRNQTQGGYFVQLRDTHIHSPRTMSESQLFIHHQYLTSRPSERGLGPFTVTVAPGVPTSFSGTFFNDQDRNTDRIRLSETITTQPTSSHTIRAGLDYSFLSFDGTNRADDVIVDLSAFYGGTAYYTYDYGAPEVTDRDETEAALYVQDTWDPNEHWTVEAGVRLDHQSIIEDTKVAPRAGFVFDPNGRAHTKIFGNWGRYYDSVFLDFVDFQNSDGVSVTCTGPCAYFGGPYVYDYVTDGEIETPYKDSWTLGFEQQMPGDMKVGVSYTSWDADNQLRTSFTQDISSLPPSIGPIDPAANAAVVFDSLGQAEYRGWEFILRKAFSRNFEFIGSYTRSRIEGDVSEAFGFENRQDNLALVPTRLSYDRPDVINLSGFWKLPRGFDFTGVFRYQSGSLYSPTRFVPGEGVVIDSTLGKNSARLDPLRSFDMSVSKHFPTGRGDLKLTAQVFNLFNNLNVVQVENRSDAGSYFGQPVEVDFGRMLQFGIEYRF